MRSVSEFKEYIPNRLVPPVFQVTHLCLDNAFDLAVGKVVFALEVIQQSVFVDFSHRNPF